MRWMKKLLLAIYLYMGIFFIVCLVCWIVTRQEPSSLIMGISAAVGVESVAAGAIRVYENKMQNYFESEREKHENRLEAEADFSKTVVRHCGDYCDGSGGDMRGYDERGGI